MIEKPCYYNCDRPVVLGAADERRWVEGWEKSRTQGGTNAVEGRINREFWAHADCVARAKSERETGISGQMALG